MAVTTPGLSGQSKNRDLFQAGRLTQIDWITLEWDVPHFGAVTVKLGELAAEPAPQAPPATIPQEIVDAFAALGQPIPPHVSRAFSPPRQFAPSFTTEELLKIAAAQLPPAHRFLGREVFIDGITPVVLAFFLSGPLRKARSIAFNVPREGGFKVVRERDPKNFEELVPGDRIFWSRDRDGKAWEVLNVGAAQVNVKEASGGRDGATLWLKRAHEVGGWA